MLGTVLVIDDESTVRRLLRRILEQEGFRVIEARDGREGLDAVARQPVNIVITDLVMPEVDGAEVIRTIRSQFPNVHLVAMTGVGRAEFERQLGVDHCRIGALVKPFNRREVLASLQLTLQ